MSEDHDEKEHKHCPFCGHHVDEDDMLPSLRIIHPLTVRN